MTEIRTLDKDHMKFITEINEADHEHLEMKEETYGSSWKRRGGVGAFMMLARKWDRLENMLGSFCKFAARQDVHASDYDVLTACELDMSGADGTPLAEIRDLRRYLILVEAEALARQDKRLAAAKKESHSNMTISTAILPLVSNRQEKMDLDASLIASISQDVGIPDYAVAGVLDARVSEPTPDDATWASTVPYRNFGLGMDQYQVLPRQILRILDLHRASLRLVPRAVPAEDSNRHAPRVVADLRATLADGRLRPLITKSFYHTLSPEFQAMYVLTDGTNAWADRAQLTAEYRDTLGRFQLHLTGDEWSATPDFARELYEPNGDDGFVMRPRFREHWGKP